MPETKTSEQPTTVQEKDSKTTKKSEQNLTNKTTEETGTYIPPKDQYKTQKLEKNDSGKPKLEVDEKTGIVTKTLVMSDPLVPEGKTINPQYKKTYHQVGMLNGKRVSYIILGADRETVLETVDCASVDR